MSELDRNERPRVVILARASTEKQAIEGETLNTQKMELQVIADRNDWEIVRVEKIVESGRKDEREKFEGLIDFCVDPKNRVKYFLVKSINRFSRQGAEVYLKHKERLERAGVQIVDAEGVIKGKENSMAQTGFPYPWADHSKSRNDEIMKAEQAHNETRDNLTRMISQEIFYTQQGYWSHASVYGFQNHKIETSEDGKRSVLLEKPDEAYFVRKMFELKGERKYSDQETVDEINRLGFKTRTRMRRDKNSKKVIGSTGENTLKVKQLYRYLQRTIYAGVICEKWTHSQGIKAKFDGLVSIELFNKANEGKVFIEAGDGKVEVKRNYSPWAIRRSKRNPLYPFKNVVLCPECKHKLLASASTGGSGQKFPFYHCARDHKRFATKPETLNKLVESTIARLQFSEEDGALFKECFMLVYEQRRTDAVTESVQYSQTLDELKIRQQSVYDTIKMTSIPSVRSRAEQEYVELDQQIIDLGEVTTKKEQKEMGARLAYKDASHLMEHLEDVLIDRENVTNQEMLFKLAFKELPTYSDLENGTLNLYPLFKLKSLPISSKEQLVTL